MNQLLHNLTLTIVLAPFVGCAVAGIGGRKIGRSASHWVTIIGIAISFIFSLYVYKVIVIDGFPAVNTVFYTWAISGAYSFDVAFLIDRLSAVMMVTVSFISLLVHIYTIQYMRDDAGYQRFFSYMSLFTFFMLVLVLANNFLLLFFGWEGVGLVSYLLIGFWFKKESAVQGSLKAFLVNRMGDLGFLLGIATILDYVGSVNYAKVFASAPDLAQKTMQIFPGSHWSVVTIISVLLFIGAMGKSAQMPLHVWLPESMEGPTPISALIHAATMVTAGIYMVARMSPLYEFSTVALSVVLVVGATGALFMGIVAIVQTDLKRVIAYSTMSQLGYMMAANGASAFSAGIFHLVTHACFKSLLFLAAGSVMIALHHEQDMRKMGGLRKYMPITYITFLIGALAMVAIPPFAGFYSKDAIIQAVHLTSISGATYAYWCLVIGTFVTALYTFRAFFLTFHAGERFDKKIAEGLHESSMIVTIPLIILAIASVLIGVWYAVPMLYSTKSLLGNAVFSTPQLNVLAEMAKQYHNIWYQTMEGFIGLPFWFAVAGIVVAYLCYIRYPELPEKIRTRFRVVYQILFHKYGFDAFNNLVFVRGGRSFSNFCFYVADVKILDEMFVNGSGKNVQRVSKWARKMQTGYLYHYAFAMILGLCVLLIWLLLL